MVAKDRIFDSYLVARAQSGDREALARLVRHRGPRLLAHASRLMGEAEPARDIAQEAWIEIIRSLPRLRDGRAFLPWAMQITSRRVARAIKGRVRSRALEAELSHELADAATPEAGPAAADAAQVTAAIEALPPAQKATVALFYLEEFSVAEVARALDVPVGTVKTRLMHARAALRDRLGKDETDG